MKVRITIIAENDFHAPEGWSDDELIRLNEAGWNLMFSMLQEKYQLDSDEKMTVSNVEILGR